MNYRLLSEKHVWCEIGPSKPLGLSEELLLLSAKPEVLHPLDFGTVLIFAPWFPLHCRKQGEEEPSECFS